MWKRAQSLHQKGEAPMRINDHESDYASNALLSLLAVAVVLAIGSSVKHSGNNANLVVTHSIATQPSR